MNVLRSNRYSIRAAARATHATFRASPLRTGLAAQRTFASRTKPEEPKPPKPKASTPLRRTASASLPIRSNPTPTRSSIQPVFTLTTAERYALARVALNLPSGSTALHDAWWVPRYAADGREGEVFVFGNGSIVCWGLGEAAATAFARDVVASSGAEVARLREPETEDLEFVTDPSE